MTKFGDIEITQRGFGVIKFKDAYGCECSIQESSADGPYLWLGPSEADPKILASQASKHGVETDETTGWVPYPIPEEVLLTTRMHLHKEHVIELVKVLQQWLETEELKTSV